MSELLTLDDMAKILRQSRTYCRDTLVKRSDFPRPIEINRQLRYWKGNEFEAWLGQQQAASAGRPRT